MADLDRPPLAGGDAGEVLQYRASALHARRPEEADDFFERTQAPYIAAGSFVLLRTKSSRQAELMQVHHVTREADSKVGPLAWMYGQLVLRHLGRPGLLLAVPLECAWDVPGSRQGLPWDLPPELWEPFLTSVGIPRNQAAAFSRRNTLRLSAWHRDRDRRHLIPVRSGLRQRPVLRDRRPVP